MSTEAVEKGSPKPETEKHQLTVGEGIAVAGIALAAITFQSVIFVITYLVLSQHPHLVEFTSSSDWGAGVATVIVAVIYFSPLLTGYSLVKRILNRDGS